MAGDAYTGLRRKKQTPWSVRFGDALVSRLIAIGGIGTIAAILLVIIVLLGTALPLFRGADFEFWQPVPAEAVQANVSQAATAIAEADSGAHSISTGDATYVHFGVDESGLVMWGMLPDGRIESRSIGDGRLLADFPLELPAEVKITSSTLSINRKLLSVGLSDGTFLVAAINFSTRLIGPSSMPSELTVTPSLPVQAVGDTVYQWFDAKGVREIRLEPVSWSAPRRLGSEPVLALDYLADDSANRLATRSTSYALAMVGPRLVFAKIDAKRDRIRRKVTETLSITDCQLQLRSSDAGPLRIALLNGTDQAVVVWPNGALDRYSLLSGEPELVESQTAGVNQRVTYATPLLARQTLLCGLDNGRLQGWMVTRSAETEAGAQPKSRATSRSELKEGSPNNVAEDPFQLSLAHEVRIGPHAVIDITSSSNSHVAAACDDENNIVLTYVTTDSILGTEQFPLEGKLRRVAFGPDSKTLLAASDRGYALAGLDMGHPEASLRGYFGKVWYEGHDHPKYIWQSSAATEQSEIKLSLMPLIFGTLKATVYAMAISIPLAIMTAIYTSEFLSPGARGRIKPVIEMMASLPSVVLGYVAALVVAPYLQDYLMSVLLALAVFPLTFIVAGNLWNLLPVGKLVRFQGYRLLGLLACLPVAAFVTAALSPPVESFLFNGDIIAWLAKRDGSAIGGWVLLCLPVLVLAACYLLFGPLAEWNRGMATRRTPRQYAVLSLGRVLVVVSLVVAAAWLLGWTLSSLGFDLRGQLLDNYQDRNALLVGFALGFCVIPIIYTISDDALQSVPKQLRSASLGCGATPWQTTMRVVVPSAMSGLFSAVMIGLGRAVGETMVVLCAAGNTPLMEWNPFNGFKTLSAALATELPEAAKGSTHFRTLFLAAVLLFFMTLVVNTLAEFVRIRFRKRASQL